MNGSLNLNHSQANYALEFSSDLVIDLLPFNDKIGDFKIKHEIRFINLWADNDRNFQGILFVTRVSHKLPINQFSRESSHAT